MCLSEKISRDSVRKRTAARELQRQNNASETVAKMTRPMVHHTFPADNLLVLGCPFFPRTLWQQSTFTNRFRGHQYSGSHHIYRQRARTNSGLLDVIYCKLQIGGHFAFHAFASNFIWISEHRRRMIRSDD